MVYPFNIIMAYLTLLNKFVLILIWSVWICFDEYSSKNCTVCSFQYLVTILHIVRFCQFSPATTIVGCLVERHCVDVLLYIVGTHLLVFIAIHIMTFTNVLRDNLSY